jgi:REP element-mobilizing transposase RayT
LWLETLGEVCEKAGWRIHAYVMMGNHYHLLVETPEGNLVAGMKWFQGAYTQRYNSRHQVFGHLFQGRYKALVVDGEQGSYFGVVSTYIHLNPARAKLIRIGKESLARYPWSSYPAYVKGGGCPAEWLQTGRVMGSLGFKPKEVDGYEAYMEGRVLELAIKAGRNALNEEWKGIRRGWYMGGEGFRGRMLKRVKEALCRGQSGSYQGEAKRAHGEAEAERLLHAGMEALGVQASQLPETTKGMMEKAVLAWWLRQRTTARRPWICERLSMGEVSAVTRAIRLVKSGQHAKAKRMVNRLMKLSESA